ncbi:MAG TPA: 50S ribosomal protein L9 [Coriobacteriia bacterium]|nr:50S ribosomal protein L9 [Coriobacteriia bacterium]
MKVILLQELKGRGGEGDVIEVARGFAVNYLLPRKVAIEATSGNLKQLEQRSHNIQKREEQRVGSADSLRGALDGKSVTIGAKVGEEGRLFGSVTSLMIEEAIREQLGVEVDRRKIETHGHIKEAGPHTVDITVYRDIKAQLTVNVVAEGETVPQTNVTEVEGITAEGGAFVEIEETLAVEEAAVDEAEASDEDAAE